MQVACKRYDAFIPIGACVARYKKATEKTVRGRRLNAVPADPGCKNCLDGARHAKLVEKVTPRQTRKRKTA